MTRFRGQSIRVLSHGGIDNANGATVLLADDQRQERVGIRYALEHGGFSVVAEAANAAQAVAAALRYEPEVCLLDVDMPGGGLAAAEGIISRLPGTKVAIFSGSGHRADVFAAIRAGADGYLLKGTPPDGLSVAALALVHGEAALPRSLTAQLFSEIRRHGQRRRRLAVRSRVLYPSRFVRHLSHRLRVGMAPHRAWRSARSRMTQYD